MDDPTVTELIEIRQTGRGVKNPKDYIPIHTSDRQQFKRCRRRWNWNSPTRENYIPKRATQGIYFPLWFGTGMHAALEYFYTPEHMIPVQYQGYAPVEIFQEWFQVESDYLSINAPQWCNEHAEELMEHYDLGIGMMNNYVQYAALHDNFKVIATEHDFAVPLGFDMYDQRSGINKPVMYCGRQDLIIQDLDTGEYGIMDHKTASSMGEDYFQKLELDEQCTSYLWAAYREEGLLPDGAEPGFVLYNVLRKVAPTPPTVLKNGTLSIARTTESCTFEQWNEAVDFHGLRDTDWYRSEKVQMYEDYLRREGWDLFFKRATVYRNAHEIEQIGEQIKLEAHDMLNLPNIYPNPTGDWYCLRCPFRAPCLATNDGGDVDYMLQENYERNIDR